MISWSLTSVTAWVRGSRSYYARRSIPGGFRSTPRGKRDSKAQENTAAEMGQWPLILVTDQPGRLLDALRKWVILTTNLSFYPVKELKEIVEALAIREDLLLSPQATNRSRRVIRSVLIKVIQELGPHRVPKHLWPALKGQGIGQGSGAVRLDLLGEGQGRLDWRRTLRRQVGQALEERPVFSRPPRRFPELIGVLPGRRRLAVRPRIMAAIDTSGSMSAGHLEQIDAELARLDKVLVVECATTPSSRSTRIASFSRSWGGEVLTSDHPWSQPSCDGRSLTWSFTSPTASARLTSLRHGRRSSGA
jgi:hypothetical protein